MRTGSRVGFDIYFLSLLMEQKELEDRLESGNLTDELYIEAKKAGLTDKYIEKETASCHCSCPSLRRYMRR